MTIIGQVWGPFSTSLDAAFDAADAAAFVRVFVPRVGWLDRCQGAWPKMTSSKIATFKSFKTFKTFKTKKGKKKGRRRGKLK